MTVEADNPQRTLEKSKKRNLLDSLLLLFRFVAIMKLGIPHIEGVKDSGKYRHSKKKYVCLSGAIPGTVSI